MQRYLQYHRKELAESSEFWTDPLPQNTWDVISTMKGLRRLKVQFLCKLDIYVDGEDGLPSPLEANLLEPLMKLNWIPDLSVEVSWPASQDSKEFMGNAPFEIIRKYDEEIEVHYEKTRW
ncbi:hypothetical protein N7456_010343 [Penicillium angulare]|uniref:Uncharacterized protein n=1 Tax=Penicillium angulare TaxID=116970 RepID=A0A9W9F6I1_9EURO|nr:hypothetical protein N7456_010343 [Penicillium angulare]